MGQATLMYGIGATKAGTSWLYRYLASHPECAMPPVKELHYFNTDTEDQLEWQLNRLARNAVEVRGDLVDPINGVNVVGKRRFRALEEASGMLAAPRDGHLAYVDYLMGHAGTARLVGDVTPAYSLLAPEKLREMAGVVAKTRFIYILRDPIERLWSNIRVLAAAKEDAKTEFPLVANRLMDQSLGKSDHNVIKRSNYKAALENLEAAVPVSSRLVLFFEELFSVKTVERICEFLGLNYHPADMSFRVNEGPALELDGTRRKSAWVMLREQYEAVAERFGDLPEAWQRNMVRG